MGYVYTVNELTGNGMYRFAFHKGNRNYGNDVYVVVAKAEIRTEYSCILFSRNCLVIEE